MKLCLPSPTIHAKPAKVREVILETKIAMTDITRPSNPALSFSSFNDVPVAYRMTAYPDRIEILSPSPRTTITSDDLEATDDDGRSKSAPPNPSRAQLELEKIEEVIVLSSTYDPRRFSRPDSAPPPHSSSPNVRQTLLMSEKNSPRNPEIGVLHVLRTPNAGATPSTLFGGQQQRYAASNNAAAAAADAFENPNRNTVCPTDWGERTTTTDAQEDSLHYRSSFSHSQEEEQQHRTTIDGRQLSRPIPQTPSRLSTILLPQQQDANNEERGGGGDTLILRPNPVKPAIITTANLSPAELVRAAATLASEQQQQVVELQQQHCADEETTPTTHERTSQQPNNHQETTPTTTTAPEEKKVNETWNTAQARQAEKEAKRMLREAQQQRKQEFQVNFPEDNNATFAMPYASSSHEEKLSGNNHHHSARSSSNNEAARMRHSQQQAQNHHHARDRTLRESSGAESLGNRTSNRNGEDGHPDGAPSVHPIPLFERLVTEEVQELKTYAGIVERQNIELAKQKKVQEDLEARLRGETRRRKELESLLEEQERLWSEKFAELEEERNTAEKKLQDEQTKTTKLINQVQRKDRDIHDFFKKKVRVQFVTISPYEIKRQKRTFCSHLKSFFCSIVRSRWRTRHSIQFTRWDWSSWCGEESAVKYGWCSKVRRFPTAKPAAATE